MRLIIDSDEYWIRDGIELPSNFDSMTDYEKEDFFCNNKMIDSITK